MEKGKKCRRETGLAGGGREKCCIVQIVLPSNPCQACFPPASPMMAPAIRHTPAEQASDWITGHLPQLSNYCGVFVDGPGRRSRIEWIRGLAVPVFLMPQNAVDDAGICNSGWNRPRKIFDNGVPDRGYGT
jgi:hypothetical protein